MTDRDWDAEMKKIDRQIEGVTGPALSAPVNVRGTTERTAANSVTASAQGSIRRTTTASLSAIRFRIRSPKDYSPPKARRADLLHISALVPASTIRPAALDSCAAGA